MTNPAQPPADRHHQRARSPRDQQRHADRLLDPEQLGPAQRAAVDAAIAGVRSVSEYLDNRGAGILDSGQLDFAERLLIHLRSLPRELADEAAVLRVFAANDWMLEAPDGEIRTHACPTCGLPAAGGPRYPRAVCFSCSEDVTDSEGRPIVGRNATLLGGFEAYFRNPDGTDGDVCAEVTDTGRCWIAGRPCTIGEARFGGVVVQA